MHVNLQRCFQHDFLIQLFLARKIDLLPVSIKRNSITKSRLLFIRRIKRGLLL